MKREITHVHVVVVQKRQRNVQKSMVHAQSCCFANKTYCFLTFSLPSASLDLKVPDITSFAPCSFTVAYQELHLRAVRSGVLREQTSLPQQYRDDWHARICWKAGDKNTTKILFNQALVCTVFKSPRARFSKVSIINGPVKLLPFTFKIEVLIVLHLTW